jgi:hypothetical protein
MCRYRSLTQLFQNSLHDDFGTRAWTSSADRLSEEAEVALSKGHRTSTREFFLRANVFYAASYYPLYGEPEKGKADGA